MSDYRDTLKGKTLIAAHRGIAGGNIACNSLPGFQAALVQGADIIELDIAISLDGTQYVFHPGKERLYLQSDRSIAQMHDDEIEEMRLVNSDGARTSSRVPRFSQCLEYLKGKCLINVDKFYTDIPNIAATIRKSKMEDQVIVKAPPTQAYLNLIKAYASDLPFMPFLRNDDGLHEALLKDKQIRYIGAEVLFDQNDSAVASPAFIDKVHKDGCVMWVNSIVYDEKVCLSAGHTDDIALGGQPEIGWGWLIERGFDILQTDWPLALRLFGSKAYPRQFDAVL